MADTADENGGEDTGAAFVADETEFNIFNTDRKLAAIEQASRKLAALPEKKALIYFSSGVGKTGVENQAQLRATVNSAMKANVAIYPDRCARPDGQALRRRCQQGRPPRHRHLQRRGADRSAHALNDSQETLTTLAADTGGKTFIDSNDLSLGIVQAQQELRSYYIVGYYSTNDAQDGHYRKITVKLNNVQSARWNIAPATTPRRSGASSTPRIKSSS